MPRVILASQSKSRKLLFSSLGIPFITMPAQIDERKIRDKNLKTRAQKIADAKANKIINQYPDSIVIACDTFSECDGLVLEKPENISEAKKMLKLLSGRKAINYTSLRYIDRSNKIDFKKTVKVTYNFRTLYNSEIDQYVEKFPVTEWAAGFALVEPYILTFVSKVNGSFTGISHGLPTELLIPLLKKSGFEPRPRK